MLTRFFEILFQQYREMTIPILFPEPTIKKYVLFQNNSYGTGEASDLPQWKQE